MAQIRINAANATYRLLRVLYLMSSEMFSAVYETQTVTCLVEVQLVGLNCSTRPDH